MLNSVLEERIDYILNKQFSEGAIYYIGKDEEGFYFRDAFSIDKLRTNLDLVFITDINKNMYTFKDFKFNNHKRFKCICTSPLILRVAK